MTTKVVNCHNEPFEIYIGRGSPYGNPFKIGVDGNRKECILKYKQYLSENPELIKKILKELKDKTLGCHCKPKDCHGDVIVEIIESYENNLDDLFK
jgi:hypothetical protein